MINWGWHSFLGQIESGTGKKIERNAFLNCFRLKIPNAGCRRWLNIFYINRSKFLHFVWAEKNINNQIYNETTLNEEIQSITWLSWKRSICLAVSIHSMGHFFFFLTFQSILFLKRSRSTMWAKINSEPFFQTWCQ